MEYRFHGAFILPGWQDLNLQPAVLETAALPIELHPIVTVSDLQSIIAY